LARNNAPFQLRNTLSHVVDKNLYVVADNDSNGDGFLSEEDAQNLYSSEYNGKNLKLILKDILDYRTIDDHELLILKEGGEQVEFYYYDLKSETLIKLNTDF
jgi:hypothetical protein